MLKQSLGKAVGSLSHLMKSCAPVLKISAAAISTAMVATTGVSLGKLNIDSVVKMAEDFNDAKEFVDEYCEALESLGNGEESRYDFQIKPGEGLEPIQDRQEQLRPIARDAYFQFLRFLKVMGCRTHSSHCARIHHQPMTPQVDHTNPHQSNKFDETKLLENGRKVPGPDGMRWEAITDETNRFSGGRVSSGAASMSEPWIVEAGKVTTHGQMNRSTGVCQYHPDILLKKRYASPIRQTQNCVLLMHQKFP